MKCHLQLWTLDGHHQGSSAMATLPKYTLSKSGSEHRWELRADKTDKLIKFYETKADATAGGVLKKEIGGIGSVKIEKENGRYQEERTFPHSADPNNSPG
jgi:hypothetical protein